MPGRWVRDGGEKQTRCTGLWPGCPLGTDAHMRRAGRVLQRWGAEHECRIGSSPECPLGTNAHMRRAGEVLRRREPGRRAHAVTELVPERLLCADDSYASGRGVVAALQVSGFTKMRDKCPDQYHVEGSPCRQR